MNKNNIFRFIIFTGYPIFAILATIFFGVLIKLKLPYDIKFIFPPDKTACDLFIQIFQLPISIFITSLISWILLLFISINYIQKQKKTYLTESDFDPDDTFDFYSNLNDEQRQHKIEGIDNIKISSRDSLWSSLLIINGFLFTILSLLMSLNKSNHSRCLIFIFCIFIITILMSSSLILINYYKIRKQAHLNLFLLDKELPIKKDKSRNMLNIIYGINDKLIVNENWSIRLIAFAFALLLILFIFIY